MKNIDHAFIAPLIRGYIIGISGKPVIVTYVNTCNANNKLVINLPESEDLYPSCFEAAFKSTAPKNIPDCVIVQGNGFEAFYSIKVMSSYSKADRSKIVSGKVVLVTGGAQGFGAEITKGFLDAGSVVFVADINFDGAKKFCDTLCSVHGSDRAIPVVADVANYQSVKDMFDFIAKTTGGLDVVVSNAGVLKASSLLSQNPDDFKLVTDVNYTGFFNVAKYAAIIMMRQSYGATNWYTDIIQINSKSGLVGSNKNAAYAGSKFGSIGLVQSYALELVDYGIKVNAVCPGNFFNGPLWSDPVKGLFIQYLNSGKVPGAKTIADVKAFYEAKVPMRRGCDGQDVLKAIFYLIEQDYETGQALPVSGGQVMLH